MNENTDMMMARGGNGVFTTKLRVDVTELRRGGETTQTIDGRPTYDLSAGEMFEGLELTTTYTGTMTRTEGRNRLLLEWVDHDGQGHRFSMPDEVIEMILRGRKSLVKKSRSKSSRDAAAVRKADGFVPFQKKDELEEPMPDLTKVIPEA